MFYDFVIVFVFSIVSVWRQQDTKCGQRERHHHYLTVNNTHKVWKCCMRECGNVLRPVWSQITCPLWNRILNKWTIDYRVAVLTKKKENNNNNGGLFVFSNNNCNLEYYIFFIIPYKVLTTLRWYWLVDVCKCGVNIVVNKWEIVLTLKFN